MNKPIKVKFQECTKAEYEAMPQHFNNVVYSLYDVGELYKGDIAFSGGEPGPGPSGEDFVVTYTVDLSSGEPVFSADKTFAEIIAAIEEGKNVKAKLGDSIMYSFEISDFSIRFAYILASEFDGINVTQITHYNNDNISGIEVRAAAD